MLQNDLSTDNSLHLLSERLSKVSTIQDLLEAILGYLQHLGVNSAVIFAATPSPRLASRNFQIVAEWAKDEISAALKGLFSHFSADETSFSCDKLVIVEECETSDTNSLLSEFLTRLSYRACVLIPLKVHNQWIGAICLCWKTQQTFSDSDKHIFSTIGHQAAWVMYGVALHSQIQQRIKRTELLLHLSTQLSRASDEQEVVDAVARVANNYGADEVMLSYIDSSTSSTLISVMSRWQEKMGTPKQLRLGRARPLPEFLKQYIGEAPPNQAIFIDDMHLLIQQEDSLLLERTGFICATCAVIPLWQGHWQGLLTIKWQQPHRFAEEEENIYTALVQVLGPIVASRRSYLAQEAARRESEQRAKELETVSKVSAAASQNLDFEQLLQTVVDLSQSRFNLYNAHIYLLDSQKQHLILAATSGETGRVMKELGITKLLLGRDPSIAARCARAKEGIILNDVTKSPDFIPNPLLPEVRSELAVPMLLGNQLIGVLNLQSKNINHFTENILLVMRALADEIAVAVRNVDLFQKQRSVAEELRKLDQLKSQFLANMSHELRTPLNAIRNFTYFVASGILGPVTEKQVDALGKVTQGATQLLGLINDILDFSKIEAGMMQLYVEEVDIASLLDSVLSVVNGLPRSERVRLDIDVEPKLSTIHADKQRLRQILINLLSNALKFTKEGQVRLMVRQSQEEILFSVSDTGPGIAPEEQDVIFEAFRQTNESIGSGGTGLGLPISKHLAEAHGGRIWLSSQLNTGTTFFVALPLTNPATKPSV